MEWNVRQPGFRPVFELWKIWPNWSSFLATMGHRWKLPTMLHPGKGQANVCNKLTILKCDHCTLYIPHTLVLKRPIVFDVGHMIVIMVKSHRVASRRSYISSTCHFQVITSHPIHTLDPELLIIWPSPNGESGDPPSCCPGTWFCGRPPFEYRSVAVRGLIAAEWSSSAVIDERFEGEGRAGEDLHLRRCWGGERARSPRRVRGVIRRIRERMRARRRRRRRRGSWRVRRNGRVSIIVAGLLVVFVQFGGFCCFSSTPCRLRFLNTWPRRSPVHCQIRRAWNWGKRAWRWNIRWFSSPGSSPVGSSSGKGISAQMDCLGRGFGEAHLERCTKGIYLFFMDILEIVNLMLA